MVRTARSLVLLAVCITIVAVSAPSDANALSLALARQTSVESRLAIPQQRCGVLKATDILIPQEQHTEPLAMLRHWHRHALAPFMNCFTVTTYALEQLNCEQQGERGRAHCQLATTTGRVASVREIMFVPEASGIAFNDSQRIVLPINASLELFAHEVAHWLGFVDEYPMAATLAREFCAGRYQHPSLNVVVTRSRQVSEAELIALWQRLPWQFAVRDWRDLATQQADGRWQLGSAASRTQSSQQQVGLYPVQTCATTPYYAWRPVSSFTPMQYHDVSVWPAIYLQLLRQ